MTLNEYITRYKIDKDAFAAEIGLKFVNSLYAYLNGNRTPNREMMLAITKATKGKVTPNDFYLSK